MAKRVEDIESRRQAGACPHGCKAPGGDAAVEDVPHFLLKCTAYKRLRDELLGMLRQTQGLGWDDLPQEKKISALLGFDDGLSDEVYAKCSNFIRQAYKVRSTQLEDIAGGSQDQEEGGEEEMGVRIRDPRQGGLDGWLRRGGREEGGEGRRDRRGGGVGPGAGPTGMRRRMGRRRRRPVQRQQRLREVFAELNEEISQNIQLSRSVRSIDSINNVHSRDLSSPPNPPAPVRGPSVVGSRPSGSGADVSRDRARSN
jgi:hypothetical protein